MNCDAGLKRTGSSYHAHQEDRMTNMVQGQAKSTRPRWWAVAFLVWALTTNASVRADQPYDLAALVELQQQIERVVSSTMPACVSIGDGTGFGSGAVIDSQGTILTAGHVISAGVTKFEVYFPDGRKTEAELIGYLNDLDAGIIKITEPGPWPTVPVANSVGLQPGDWTICLGHSGGYELGRKPPVRTGRVLEYREHLVVTDAVLIGGDSGGPLFNLQGELIAIHSSIGDSVAENRHVSIDTFHRQWSKLKRGGDWTPPARLVAAKPAAVDQQLAPIVSGNSLLRENTQNDLPATQSSAGETRPVDAVPIVSSAASKLGLSVIDTSRGIQVQSVMPGSAAERVGIRVNDLVMRFDGTRLDSAAQLMQRVDAKQVGQSASIEIVRQGRSLNLQVILDRL
jgi:serine protease Do